MYEQSLFVHIDEIGNFEDQHPVRREQRAHPLDHTGQVVDVGEHVVGGDAPGRTSLPADGPGLANVEECRPGLNPGLVGRGRDVSGRLNPQHTHPRRLERAQQRSVVGPNVDDQIVWREPKVRDNGARIVREMCDEHRRGPADIHIILVQHLGVDDIQELHVRATFAEPHVERIGGLRLGQVSLGDKRVGRWRRRQCQDLDQPAAAAQPAGVSMPAGLALSSDRYGATSSTRSTSDS